MLLKQLKQGLKFGDITKLSITTGYSAPTIHNALKGDAITDTDRIIIEAALKLVKENADEALRIYQGGRAEFERQKKANP